MGKTKNTFTLPLSLSVPLAYSAFNPHIYSQTHELLREEAVLFHHIVKDVNMWGDAK